MIPQGYKAAMMTPMQTPPVGFKVYCHACKKEVNAITQFSLENPWGAFDFNYGYQLACGHMESTVPQERKQ